METIEEGDNPQVKFKFGMMVEITEPGLVDTGERGVVTHVSSGMYACTVAFESGTSAVLYWRWLTPVADDTPAPDLAAQLAEARRELAAAKDAIRATIEYYVDDESAQAAILSYVNGYEGSPDLRIDQLTPKAKRRDEKLAAANERIAALEAANRRLWDALRPFAEAADDIDVQNSTEDTALTVGREMLSGHLDYVHIGIYDDDGNEMQLEVRHLRAAHDALKAGRK